ncbi:MAG: hypothetical protein ABSF51_13995 [Verrucomicrobiota bacterium]
MITDHPLRVISRQLCAAANAATDRAKENDTPSSHLLAAKIADAASCCLTELELAGQRLPGDRDAELQFIVNANFHREKIPEARSRIERG